MDDSDITTGDGGADGAADAGGDGGARTATAAPTARG